MDLNTLGLLAGLSALVLIGAYLWRALRPPPPGPPTADAPGLDRLSADSRAANLLLTLGAHRAVPGLIAQLTAALDDPQVEPTLVARGETLLADFGLASIRSLAAALAEHAPHTAQGASLARVIHRLGPHGLRAVLAEALEAPEIAAHLPRLLAAAPDPADLIVGALLARPVVLRARDLQILAGCLVVHPEALLPLWELDPEGRPALLGWLNEWPSLAPPELALRALSASDPAVCAAGATLCGLLPGDPARAAALRILATDGPPAGRAAALWALARDPEAGGCLRAGLAEPEREVAYAAAAAWAAHPSFDPAVPAKHLDADLTRILGGDLEAALEALEHPDPQARCLAVLRCAATLDRALPAATPGGGSRRVTLAVRIRERLIRIADGGPTGRDRIAAVHHLGCAGEALAPEWLFACVLRARDGDLAWLQRAAQAIGERAARPLARRAPAEAPHRLPALMAVLRALPLEGATPSLLQLLGGALDAPRGPRRPRFGAFEAETAATLRAGGAAVRAAIDLSLSQPGQGLVAQGLRYLALYASPSDLPRLLEVAARVPPQRATALHVIEGLGAAALPALEAQVDAGGDDPFLQAIEACHARLRACLGGLE